MKLLMIVCFWLNVIGFGIDVFLYAYTGELQHAGYALICIVFGIISYTSIKHISSTTPPR